MYICVYTKHFIFLKNIICAYSYMNYKRMHKSVCISKKSPVESHREKNPFMPLLLYAYINFSFEYY